MIRKGFYFSLLLLFLSIIPSRAELVAHWPLDNDANDATGNGHDGQIANGTVLFENIGASNTPEPRPLFLTMAELISLTALI